MLAWGGGYSSAAAVARLVTSRVHLDDRQEWEGMAKNYIVMRQMRHNSLKL